MATWQQGNSGGLLAGLGQVNSNAPQVQDINAAAGLIRENNDLQQSGANNSALTGLQGLAGVAQMYQQEQQKKAQAAFNQAHANAWATGDTSALRDFAVANPAFVQQAQQAVSGLNDQQKSDIGTQAAGLRMAISQGPESLAKYVSGNAKSLSRIGADPNTILSMGVSDPQQAQHLVDTIGMASLGGKDYFDAIDKQAGRVIDRGKLAETVRSNQAGEALTSRGQDITARGQDIGAATARRGQDISLQNSMRSAGGAIPASVREYQYFNSLSPEQQQTYLRVRGRPDAAGDNTVQLSDGRTVTVSGKLHGAGASAFYEGKDDAGNMVRVPASAISAPPTAAATATNYAMKKDLDSIINSDSNNLDFMTGVTGGTGSTAVGADVRSRAKGGDQRQLYNAAQRVQGRMQNQGVAAARDMGASGINTVAEAKMYFQSMPQVDYSSPDSLKESMRGIQEYTDNYNQQYNVNIGGGKQIKSAQQSTQPQQASGYSSLWGD